MVLTNPLTQGAHTMNVISRIDGTQDYDADWTSLRVRVSSTEEPFIYRAEVINDVNDTSPYSSFNGSLEDVRSFAIRTVLADDARHDPL
ncbi:MAG: hypothetical protein ACRCZP_11560 [Phycicoccus sp.]